MLFKFNLIIFIGVAPLLPPPMPPMMMDNSDAGTGYTRNYSRSDSNWPTWNIEVHKHQDIVVNHIYNLCLFCSKCNYQD